MVSNSRSIPITLPPNMLCWPTEVEMVGKSLACFVLCAPPRSSLATGTATTSLRFWRWSPAVWMYSRQGNSDLDLSELGSFRLTFFRYNFVGEGPFRARWISHYFCDDTDADVELAWSMRHSRIPFFALDDGWRWLLLVGVRRSDWGDDLEENNFSVRQHYGTAWWPLGKNVSSIP